MSLFTQAKASRAASKIAEELTYEQVAAEVAAGAIRQGLWVKAISQSAGNEATAKARYIKLRVEMINAESELSEYAAEQAVKERRRAEKREAQAEMKRRAARQADKKQSCAKTRQAQAEIERRAVKQADKEQSRAKRRQAQAEMERRAVNEASRTVATIKSPTPDHTSTKGKTKMYRILIGAAIAWTMMVSFSGFDFPK